MRNKDITNAQTKKKRHKNVAINNSYNVNIVILTTLAIPFNWSTLSIVEKTRKQQSKYDERTRTKKTHTTMKLDSITMMEIDLVDKSLTIITNEIMSSKNTCAFVKCCFVNVYSTLIHSFRIILRIYYYRRKIILSSCRNAALAACPPILESQNLWLALSNQQFRTFGNFCNLQSSICNWKDYMHSDKVDDTNEIAMPIKSSPKLFIRLPKYARYDRLRVKCQCAIGHALRFEYAFIEMHR